MQEIILCSQGTILPIPLLNLENLKNNNNKQSKNKLGKIYIPVTLQSLNGRIETLIRKAKFYKLPWWHCQQVHSSDMS